MHRLFFTVIASLLFISSAMAQLTSNVEEAQRYRVNQPTVVLEKAAFSNIGYESASNGVIHNRSNSQLEELGTRYIFIRSNSQLEELGTRYIFIR